MQYQVEDRSFINDSGNKVEYKRLVITGYADGEIQSIELSISKDQATIYKIMQASHVPVSTSRKANKAEEEDFQAGILD